MARRSFCRVTTSKSSNGNSVHEAYDQSVWAANAKQLLDRYAALSDDVRARLGKPQRFSYGPTPVEALDVYRGTMHQTQADVLEQLRAAFPPTPLNFEGALTGGLDEGAYREHVEGKTWEEIDRKYVLSRSDVLSFLETQHLIAVLPVYLRSLVEDGTRTPVPDTVLLVLNRKKQERFEELINALDPAQHAAVIAVLELFATNESGQPAEAARAALERWKGYSLAGSQRS